MTPLRAVHLSTIERERIRLVDRFVSNSELQLFMRASDMAVFPYTSILTSGSLMLALSFGLPGNCAGCRYDA